VPRTRTELRRAGVSRRSIAGSGYQLTEAVVAADAFLAARLEPEGWFELPA
jgi:hypothetical protein